ncbi:hypothetical protein EDEG_00423 [Edhazardia aedis USNM 41457]|uniref:F-box domain-containing protein n=1 Tax=Edhazardia aedis (strain USNM 41457) TaxID=1003232 RepID=J9DJI5_EDHAE|nr:hypothetical protein EDEG_00423 [Edhazardia aedis USNM 41457]|eukprot:EJW01532.1 hypothetical protein EDEG_00423 [Edhazardia aedis USNM 41457]
MNYKKRRLDSNKGFQEQKNTNKISHSHKICMNPEKFYSLPCELHYKILQNLSLSQTRTFMFSNKKNYSILHKNYQFWRDKYLNEYEEEDQSFDTVEEFKEKIKEKITNRLAVIRGDGEIKYDINSDQLDITHIITKGEYIFCSSDDQRIKIYRNRVLESVLSGHFGGVWAFDVTNNFIVSGSTDKTIRIWERSSGACLHVLKGHRSTIRCLKATESHIVSGGRDSFIKVWDFMGNLLHTLNAHSLSVRCIDTYQNLVVSGSYDGTVVVWDFIDGKKLYNLKYHLQRVYCVKIDKKYIISGGQDGNIFVSNHSGNLLHSLKGHRSIVAWLAINYENKREYLFSSGADGNVVKWDMHTGQKEYTIHEQAHITGMKIYNGLMVVARNNGVNLYSTKSGKLIRSLLDNALLVYDITFVDNRIIIGYKSANSAHLMILDYKITK